MSERRTTNTGILQHHYEIFRSRPPQHGPHRGPTRRRDRAIRGTRAHRARKPAMTKWKTVKLSEVAYQVADRVDNPSTSGYDGTACVWNAITGQEILAA